MVEMTAPQPTDLICDPACGTAGFLVIAGEYLRERYPEAMFSLHLHDTRRMAMPNILAGLEAGVTEFDGTVGGLGGCPYAPGATGNVATMTAPGPLSYLTRMAYDSVGNLKSRIDPNLHPTTYDYDAREWHTFGSGIRSLSEAVTRNS